MAEEQTPDAPVEQKPTEIKEEIKEEVPSEPVDDKKPTEENPIQNKEEKQEESEAIKEALKKKEELEAELKKYEDLDDNVYEVVNKLEKDLAEKKRLAELTAKTAELEAKIQEINKGSMIDSIIASGKLSPNLKDWANSLTFDQLKQFNENAVKMKTILDQENSDNQPSKEVADRLSDWYAKNSKTDLSIKNKE